MLVVSEFHFLRGCGLTWSPQANILYVKTLDFFIFIKAKDLVKNRLRFLGGLLRNRYLLFALRVVLGIIFVVAAAGKLPRQAEFVDVVTGRGLLPWHLALAYGSVLPWLELIVGLCLIVGFLPRLAAGTTILMVLSFIVANGTAVVKGQYLDCGCFGAIFFLDTSNALIMDIFIVGMALLILLYGSSMLSLHSLAGAVSRRQQNP